MEDLAHAAFAGQHDTFLNCRDPEAVLAALRDCYLSLWHDRAIAYRHRHGCDHTAAHMAVVVQEMADCDAAGVAFSMNPVSGDLGVAVIDANYGLGESVVSGDCEVDHWEVGESNRDAWSRRASPARPCAPSSAENGGIEDEAIDEDDGVKSRSCPRSNSPPSPALLLRVESWFRFPQDIEWGFAGDGWCCSNRGRSPRSRRAGRATNPPSAFRM